MFDPFEFAMAGISHQPDDQTGAKISCAARRLWMRRGSIQMSRLWRSESDRFPNAFCAPPGVVRARCSRGLRRQAHETGATGGSTTAVM